MERTAKLFAENLKRFREMRKLTQEALSERLGVSVVTISNYENGRRWPEPEMMDSLCAVLGVEPVDLFLAFGARPVPTPEEALRVLERAIATPAPPAQAPTDILVARLTRALANPETGAAAREAIGAVLDGLEPDPPPLQPRQRLREKGK